MKKFIFTSIAVRSLSTALWNILLYTTYNPMYNRILITDIIRYSKRGIQHNLIGHSCYKNA